MSSPRKQWYQELNRYHWYVLIIAALGWLFDTMDQQLFVVACSPALNDLLAPQLQTLSETEAYTVVKSHRAMATTIFIIGWATGGLVFGLVGDKLGRARTMILTILIYSIFTGLSAASRGWVDFATYRFLTGMGVGGEFAAGVSLVAEVMPAAARPYALGFLQALSAVGNMTAAGLSILIRPQTTTGGIAGWRVLFLIGIIPALLVVFIRRGLKEPEAWQRAKQESLLARDQPGLGKQLGNLRELWGDPRWRYHAIVGVLLSTVGVMMLWGVGFWTVELVRENVLGNESKDVQDKWAGIASLVQNLGAFFGIYGFSLIAGRLGRRPAFAISFILAWLAIVLVFGFLTRPMQILWMIPILGFCTLMPFGGYAIYFPELFPTRLRATGTGICYNVARYLAAAAPLILGQLVSRLTSTQTERSQYQLSDFTLLSSLGSDDHVFRYATIIVASVALAGLLVLIFAPETKDRPLPE